MDIVIATAVIALLILLLHRDDRRHHTAERYWSAGAGVDHDVERVRADLLAGADALSRRPLRRSEPRASDWEPRA
ncbi:hypothetical protein [Pseudactinotalea sp.]|uniref:hypothetical protein n=1 Tax=Pseudactinotalea sp. TaxID=1926260 RepID=UPI003B3A3785